MRETKTLWIHLCDCTKHWPEFLILLCSPEIDSTLILNIAHKQIDAMPSQAKCYGRLESSVQQRWFLLGCHLHTLPNATGHTIHFGIQKPKFLYTTRKTRCDNLLLMFRSQNRLFPSIVGAPRSEIRICLQEMTWKAWMADGVLHVFWVICWWSLGCVTDQKYQQQNPWERIIVHLWLKQMMEKKTLQRDCSAPM